MNQEINNKMTDMLKNQIKILEMKKNRNKKIAV